MKINNTAFGRVQNKALQAGVGEALDAVASKVDDVDSRMLNYTGDWVSDNEYHENDVVTWTADGHLYEVIKAHTSSATFDPDNSEYYKAMTANKKRSRVILLSEKNALSAFINAHPNAIAYLTFPSGSSSGIPLYKSHYGYFIGVTVPYEDPLSISSFQILAMSSTGKYAYVQFDMMSKELSTVNPSPAYDRVTFFY